MSAIVGVFSHDRNAATGPVAAELLARMRRRGAARADVIRDVAAAVGVARHEWEFGARCAGPVLVVHDHACVVAADASLYYRDDLRRRLAAAGQRPRGQTASHLILAAYRAWGDDTPSQLEGDFAFVVWDRIARRILAARDPAGSRPLYWAQWGDSFVLASTIDALLAHPDARTEMDPAGLSAIVDGSVVPASATAYAGVRRLEAGTCLRRPIGGAVRIEPFRARSLPPVADPSRPRSADAALAGALEERLDAGRATGAWLLFGEDMEPYDGAATLRLERFGAAVRRVHVCEPTTVAAGDRMLEALLTAAGSALEPLDASAAAGLALADASRLAGTRIALDVHGLATSRPTVAPDASPRSPFARIWRHAGAWANVAHRDVRALTASMVGRIAASASETAYAPASASPDAATLADAALAAGIELRLPLLDGRYTGVGRPLPPPARSRMEGVRIAQRLGLGAALRRRAAFVHALLATRLHVAERGGVDAAAFRTACGDALERGDDAALGGPLLRTLLAELWLRARRPDRGVGDVAAIGLEAAV